MKQYFALWLCLCCFSNSFGYAKLRTISSEPSAQVAKKVSDECKATRYAWAFLFVPLGLVASILIGLTYTGICVAGHAAVIFGIKVVNQ